MRPVFIVGFFRTGSSLLELLLEQSSRTLQQQQQRGTGELRLEVWGLGEDSPFTFEMYTLQEELLQLHANFTSSSSHSFSRNISRNGVGGGGGGGSGREEERKKKKRKGVGKMVGKKAGKESEKRVGKGEILRRCIRRPLSAAPSTSALRCCSDSPCWQRCRRRQRLLCCRCSTSSAASQLRGS